MALTTIQTGNKLVRYTQELNREYVRGNLFSPYMGEEVNAIIRIRNDLKQGGDTINLPIVRRLRNAAIGSGTLVGSEEQIDNYGQRVKVDWARNAVVTNAAEMQKDSADVFGVAKPLLADWGKELQRDEIIQALLALNVDATLPAADVRINGILYDAATTGQRDTWHTNNNDRTLYGGTVSRSALGTHAGALVVIANATADQMTGKNLSLLKRRAMLADPKIRPFTLDNGYEYFVAFMGTNPFRDLKNDLNYTATSGGGPNLLARPRENSSGIGDAPNNPLFQDGDQIYDGVIARQIPEISSMVTNKWTTLLTAGASGARVEPVFLCGQQAATLCWGQMAKPTFRKEDDYGFITGVGVQMCYGVSKIFFRSNVSGTKDIQFGMVTGFFASAADT